VSDPRVNIAATLVDMARRQPNADALLTDGRRNGDGRWMYSHTTYQSLNDRVNRIACGMKELGIGIGTRTAICVKPGLALFAVTFALFKLGAIPVLIDPGIGVRNFGRCLAQAQPEAFIGIPAAHAARRLLGWAKQTVRICITTGTFGGIPLKRIEAAGAAAGTVALADANDAAILFTSGSTGPAKGVIYTHGNFAAQIQALKETYRIEPGEKDLATFPLFALFGPALGMTTVLPQMDFTRPGYVDPGNIIEPIQQLGITNMFGSPALIERVGTHGAENGVKLPTLKRVISAGAPASPRALERFATMLAPEAEIFTPYGATEALPVTSIGSHEILAETRAMTDAGKGVCIGKPVGNVCAKVLPIRDEPIGQWSESLNLPTEQVGEIAVRGPAVTRAYFGREDATRLSKVPLTNGSATPLSNCDAFYHRMGDVGYFDAHGRLWFCGRKSQRVRLPAGDLFSMPVEGIFNAHPAVRRSALVGVERKGQTEPVVCVELLTSTAARAQPKIRTELLELAGQHDHTRQIREILFHPGFPVDIRHNAKINREQLAIWAQRKLK
jgi:acyl-coenzyme A synthetase/AMP-(fatty) acid ligase